MARGRVRRGYSNCLLCSVFHLLYVVGLSWRGAVLVTALTVRNLTQHVTWPVGSENNVRLARDAWLHDDAKAAFTSSSAKLLSLRVASNFTSASWTPCPFKNRTCSSLVEPYARISACTKNATQPLLDLNVLRPTDGPLLSKLPSRNDTYVLSLANGRYVDLNSTLASGSKASGSGQISILSWIWLSSSSGKGEVKILSKITPVSQGGLEIYSLASINGNSFRFTYQGGGGTPNFVLFLLSTTSTIDFRKPAWHHLAVIVDGLDYPRAYLDGVRLASVNNLAFSPSISDSPGTIRLGGQVGFSSTPVEEARLSGTQLLHRALSLSEIQCLSGCLERFQVNAKHFNSSLMTNLGLQVETADGGQQLIASGAASLPVYETLLRSVEFVSNEPQPDPSPRSVSIFLHSSCSSSSTWLQVVQTCSALNHTCGNLSASGVCVRLSQYHQQCLSAAQLSAKAISQVSIMCTTQATVGMVTSNTAMNSASFGATTHSSPLATINSATSRLLETSQGPVQTDSTDDDVIPGLSVGSSVAVILCIIVTVLALALLALLITRHHHKRKVLVRQNITKRRRYQYRPYAAAQPGVQLQRKSKVGSLERSFPLPRKDSMFDDIGMLPEDLQEDPRQEVREINESFFNPQLITPMMFTRPSIVPLSNPKRVRNLLPAEFDDDNCKKNSFTVTSNTHPHAPLPEMTIPEDDVDCVEPGIGATPNSIRNALSKSREDLTEEIAPHVGLDDQVLALVRTGRRGSISKPHTSATPGRQTYNNDLSLTDLHNRSGWRTVI